MREVYETADWRKPEGRSDHVFLYWNYFREEEQLAEETREVELSSGSSETEEQVPYRSLSTNEFIRRFVLAANPRDTELTNPWLLSTCRSHYSTTMWPANGVYTKPRTPMSRSKPVQRSRTWGMMSSVFKTIKPRKQVVDSKRSEPRGSRGKILPPKIKVEDEYMNVLNSYSSTPDNTPTGTFQMTDLESSEGNLLRSFNPSLFGTGGNPSLQGPAKKMNMFRSTKNLSLRSCDNDYRRLSLQIVKESSMDKVKRNSLEQLERAIENVRKLARESPRLEKKKIPKTLPAEESRGKTLLEIVKGGDVEHQDEQTDSQREELKAEYEPFVEDTEEGLEREVKGEEVRFGEEYSIDIGEDGKQFDVGETPIVVDDRTVSLELEPTENVPDGAEDLLMMRKCSSSASIEVGRGIYKESLIGEDLIDSGVNLNLFSGYFSSKYYSYSIRQYYYISFIDLLTSYRYI